MNLISIYNGKNNINNFKESDITNYLSQINKGEKFYNLFGSELENRHKTLNNIYSDDITIPAWDRGIANAMTTKTNIKTNKPYFNKFKYENKYLKYKNKYLKLKEKMNI